MSMFWSNTVFFQSVRMTRQADDGYILFSANSSIFQSGVNTMQNAEANRPQTESQTDVQYVICDADGHPVANSTRAEFDRQQAERQTSGVRRASIADVRADPDALPDLSPLALLGLSVDLADVTIDDILAYADDRLTADALLSVVLSDAWSVGYRSGYDDADDGSDALSVATGHTDPHAWQRGFDAGMLHKQNAIDAKSDPSDWVRVSDMTGMTQRQSYGSYWLYDPDGQVSLADLQDRQELYQIDLSLSLFPDGPVMVSDPCIYGNTLDLTRPAYDMTRLWINPVIPPKLTLTATDRR